MNLFALTDDPQYRILKFNLSADIQRDFECYWNGLKASFDRITEIFQFDGKYKPEENQLLEIPDFSDIDGILNAIQNPLTITDIDPTEANLYLVKALFTGERSDQNTPTALIQKFDKRKVLTTNGLSIFLSGDCFKKVEGNGITFDTKVHATLNGTVLRFCSFHLLRQIFDLSEYYKEATDQDIVEFSSNAHITIADNTAFIGVADNWIRRKILLVQQSGILDKIPINIIKAIADEYRISLLIENDKIVFPMEKAQIKTLLRFLDEDYYKSPLSQTHYMTNSKVKVQ